MLFNFEPLPFGDKRWAFQVAFHPERQRWEVELKGEMPHQDLFKIAARLFDEPGPAKYGYVICWD